MQRFPLDDKASVSEARRLIRAELQEAGAEPSVLFDCLVAVTEACTNALIHGTTDASRAAPVLAWSIDASRARFHIEDYSTEGWSRARHPSRSATVTKVEDLQVGGLGLGMINDLMDEVDIEIAAEGTRVYLVKALSLGAGSTS